jgi:hypothetical protein
MKLNAEQCQILAKLSQNCAERHFSECVCAGRR